MQCFGLRAAVLRRLNLALVWVEHPNLRVDPLQLHAIDPEITVFDPKEVPANPTEGGGTAGSALH